jgi:FkbM family methyltransferase
MSARKKYSRATRLLQKMQDLMVGRPRNAIYLGQNRILVTTAHGNSMLLDTRDVSLTPSILSTGRWERETTAAIVKMIQPGMNVVEIGANVGYFSLIFADLIGPNGTITGFEANPDICEIANRNLQINGHYYHKSNRIHEFALTDHVGEAEFSVFENHLGNSSLLDVEEIAKEVKDKTRRIKVKTTTLDAFFPIGQRIDVLKIDAEGAEPKILAGGQRVLAENKNIRLLIEFSPEFLKTGYTRPSKFLAELTEFGFKAFEITRSGNTREFTTEMADTLLVSKDLIFMR